MKEMKSYLIKFKTDSIIKKKHYFLNCIIKNKNYQLIIIIINNEYIFSINNNI